MNLDTMHVSQLMSRDVATLDRNDRLLVATDVMRLGRIRHLPVVDEAGALVGIVSQRDLFQRGLIRALGYGTPDYSQAMDSIVVKEAMRTNVVTITPEATLTEAAETMVERQVGCLVVLEGDEIAGILTESDFVKLAVRH